MAMETTTQRTAGVRINAGSSDLATELLTPEALAFITKLHRKFNGRRKELLAARRERQARFDAGERPDFLAHTELIRNDDWTIFPIPHDIRDRRVEITGPVDRKMIINALNSGAKVFMADFEDSNSPTWENNLHGQINLRDAVRRTIELNDPTNGKRYYLNDNTAVLFVRPRGWHLEERGVLVEEEPISASLFDFGLFFWHNATELILRGSGPYFYLPKLESHLEARLWNEVFLAAQKELSIPRGTIKATVLIETIPSAFEMDEILYELREHSAGLNCGRWDYIFSFIKRLGKQPGTTFPDRDQVTMATACMDAYSRLLIKTCHRRGAHAMGGMAAFIPIQGNAEANERALTKVRVDKEREALNGHDGTWVAHPALVTVAQQVFDKHMPGPSQVYKLRSEDLITTAALLQTPAGTITEAGLRKNVNVAIRYIESWLQGRGAAALDNLMEDAATAEISRMQVWQWLQHKAELDDGRTVTHEFVKGVIEQESLTIQRNIGVEKYTLGRFTLATVLFERLVNSSEPEEFLTLSAYDFI